MDTMELVRSALALIEGGEGQHLCPEQMGALLELETPELMETLFGLAYEIKLQQVGNKVYFRGIVEFSNICQKDCLYCGIRRSNTKLQRFMMDKSEIMECALWAWENGYGSIVLQSGERTDEWFVEFIEHLVKEIKTATDGELGITLSLGEQSADTYERWFEAGAHRYLLRIETSNPRLYARLHPADHDFEARMECLATLREIGYQVGTGVMIGLPWQTTEDLVRDVLFFRDMDIDMIGMGPYIPHNDTPLAYAFLVEDFDANRQLMLSLKMIALTRIFLEDVNIAATTALQALEPTGRELGLRAGANIIMPNITPTQYRKDYRLYEGKPCLEENSTMCKGCLQWRVESVGEKIGYYEWGDSPHYFRRCRS